MAAAVVTGASRGLGRALAASLVADGWTVVVDGRDEASLRVAAASFGPATRVRPIPGDITDPRHRTDLARAAAELGGIDALVNNAGALGPSPLPALADFPLGALRELLETNVVAQLAVTQELLPLLRPQGAVVMITSDAARTPYPGWGGYGATKAALEQIAAVLAAERPDLRVHSLDPGDLRTAMHQAAFPGEDISDRPEPTSAVPALRRLLDGSLPSGRHSAAELLEGVVA